MRIEFVASEKVRAAIARAGRTEDVHFSPSGSRLAVAGLIRNQLLLVDVEADLAADPARVALTGCVELSSTSLHSPHGVFWVDERTLAVANRNGGVAIFEVPARGRGSARLRLEAIRTIGGGLADLVKTPGSICASNVGLDLVELLVCNNYVHHVSRHLLDRRDGYALVASQVLLEDGLDVPDGVTRSQSGEWIAVSNHEEHSVFLYRDDARLTVRSGKEGVLRGVRYPHGLRFAPDSASLLVADAGAPHVHLFTAEDGDWRGERRPAASIQVMADETFARGSLNPQEGGPKGIALTPCGSLMVASCEEQPLAFFDMRALPAWTVAAPTRGRNMTEAEQARETLLGYLAGAGPGVDAATEAIRRASEWEIRGFADSRSWRITAPLRTAAAAVRRMGSPRKRRPDVR